MRHCIRERLVGGAGVSVDASLIKSDANRQKGIEGNKGLPPEAAGRAIDVYLAALDDAAFGAATEVTPKFVSPSDPAEPTSRPRLAKSALGSEAGRSGPMHQRASVCADHWGLANYLLSPDTLRPICSPGCPKTRKTCAIPCRRTALS